MRRIKKKKREKNLVAIVVSFVGGFYICDDCKLRYSDKKMAQKCERWCLAYHSCNLEITKHAIK